MKQLTQFTKNIILLFPMVFFMEHGCVYAIENWHIRVLTPYLEQSSFQDLAKEDAKKEFEDFEETFVVTFSDPKTSGSTVRFISTSGIGVGYTSLVTDFEVKGIKEFSDPAIKFDVFYKFKLDIKIVDFSYTFGDKINFSFGVGVPLGNSIGTVDAVLDTYLESTKTNSIIVSGKSTTVSGNSWYLEFAYELSPFEIIVGYRQNEGVTLDDWKADDLQIENYSFAGGTQLFAGLGVLF